MGGTSVGRSIPIDIPDLASRIRGRIASCLGLFRREWEDGHGLWSGWVRAEPVSSGEAGVAGWFCCATCGAANFRFSVRHHTTENHGGDWPRAPQSRPPSADSAQQAAHCLELAAQRNSSPLPCASILHGGFLGPPIANTTGGWNYGGTVCMLQGAQQQRRGRGVT